MKFLPRDRSTRVAVVGFGYVGSCVAAVLAGSGIRVFGIDNDQDLIEEMRSGYCRLNEPGLGDALADALASGLLTVSAGYEDIQAADVIVIAVGTPVDASKSVVTGYLETV